MKKTITGILTILFLFFIVKFLVDFSKPHEIANYSIKIVNDSLNLADITGIIISLITLGISLLALAQIKIAKNALKQDLDNRNLSYLSDLDKFLIESPELWGFYDVYYGKTTSDLNLDKLRGFIYFKLNHFEITLKDDRVSEDIKASWKRYMIYCMTNSSSFTKEIESILLDDGYKGLFGKRFMINLAEIYKEAFCSESDYNKKLKKDSNELEKIRNKIDYHKEENKIVFNIIKDEQMNELIKFYKDCK